MQRVCAGAIVMAALFIGCDSGPGEKSKAPVSGTVTMDGKPMVDGEIFFTEPGGTPEIVPVKDGKFEGQVTVGQKAVQVNSYKTIMVKPFPDAPAEKSQENLVDPKFNATSTLTEEVKADGNTYKFEVTSIK